MVDSGVIDRAIFSISLPVDTSKGEIVFGGYEPRHTSRIYWFPLVSQKQWEIRLDDIWVDHASLGLCSPKTPCTAVVDTGTSGIGGPAMLIERILNGIGAVPPCSENASMKQVSFVFEQMPGYGTKTFSLEPNDYSWSSPKTTSPPECPVAFMVIELPPGKGHTIVLGNTFLRKFYSVFDKEEMRIGLAAASGEQWSTARGNSWLRRFMRK